MEIWQAIGQYVPHKVKDLLVYIQACCLFLDTQSLQEKWEECESDADIMAQTHRNRRIHSTQLIIINSIFFTHCLLLRWGS